MLNVNSEDMPWREGMTVQDVLDGRGYNYSRIIVWLDGEVISDRQEFGKITVKDGSSIQVIHLFAGG